MERLVKKIVNFLMESTKRRGWEEEENTINDAEYNIPRLDFEPTLESILNEEDAGWSFSDDELEQSLKLIAFHEKADQLLCSLNENEMFSNVRDLVMETQESWNYEVTTVYFVKEIAQSDVHWKLGKKLEIGTKGISPNSRNCFACQNLLKETDFVVFHCGHSIHNSCRNFNLNCTLCLSKVPPAFEITFDDPKSNQINFEEETSLLKLAELKLNLDAKFKVSLHDF